MNAVNLIPPAILQRRHQRRAVLAWGTAAMVVFFASCALVLLASQQNQPAEDQDLGPELLRIQHEVALVQAQERAVIRQIDLTRRQVQAAGVVSGQPNWEGLIEVIASQLGDDAVVTLFQFGPADSPEVARAADFSGSEAAGVWLVIGGVAEDHNVVPALVLRFEALGLFQQVTLIETRRISFEGNARTAFRIRCKID